MHVERQHKLLDESYTKLEEKSKELVIANQQLALMANSDALTGIANRRCMDEHLQKEWLRAIKNQCNICFILLDIDCFKQYVGKFITISVGVFTCFPQQGSTADFIFERADKALYKAKESGKNKVCFFNS